jgi:hypothetical protein
LLISDIKLNIFTLIDMSKMIQNVSRTTQDGANKSHAAKQSSPTTKTNINSDTFMTGITGYEYDLGDKLEQLERTADMQSQQLELGECLEFVAQLVDLFKHTVITYELQNENDWHNDAQHHLKQHKGATDNRHLDDKVEEIVINKGLTKEQWSCLLYIALSNGDAVEISKVTKKHLQKVHDMASRLLENDEKNAVFALINAIEKHMSKKYFTEK